MTTHTPGPWSYESEDNIIYSADGMRLIDVSIVPRSIHVGLPQRKANGQLAASAPELLEALKDMLSGWKYIRESHGDLYGVGWDRAQDKAEEAIRKATGA